MKARKAIHIAIHAMEEESHRYETKPYSDAYRTELGKAIDRMYKLEKKLKRKELDSKE